MKKINIFCVLLILASCFAACSKSEEYDDSLLMGKIDSLGQVNKDLQNQVEQIKDGFNVKNILAGDVTMSKFQKLQLDYSIEPLKSFLAYNDLKITSGNENVVKVFGNDSIMAVDKGECEVKISFGGKEKLVKVTVDNKNWFNFKDGLKYQDVSVNNSISVMGQDKKYYEWRFLIYLDDVQNYIDFYLYNNVDGNKDQQYPTSGKYSNSLDIPFSFYSTSYEIQSIEVINKDDKELEFYFVGAPSSYLKQAYVSSKVDSMGDIH